jgi:arylsulfatase A-like enzyme
VSLAYSSKRTSIQIKISHIVSILLTLFILALFGGASAHAQLANIVTIGKASVDHVRVDGLRWSRVYFKPEDSGNHTLRVHWDGNADIRFSVFEILNPVAVADESIIATTPLDNESTIDFMPAIQKHLVQEGTSYTNTIVPTPSCCPSRATTLTGEYVHNNKQFQQKRVNEQIFEKTLQKHLKNAGYFTGHAGKYLHWLDPEVDPVPPYWDRWTYISGGFYGVGMNFDGSYIKPGGYTTDIIFECSKHYLRDFEARDDDNPWFVYIAPLSPHSPYTAEYDFKDAAVPELASQSAAYMEVDISDKPAFLKYRPMSDREARNIHEARARNLISLDREIEQLIAYLEASGELDNTMIVFTSDNGYILGEHQTFGKFTPYRDSVEVPLVIRWPGRVPKNVVSESFVSHVDIAPTILHAAGIDTSAIGMDGRNIFDDSRNTFYMEYFLDSEANGGRVGDWASLRTNTYQYTEWYASDGSGDVVFREYYDMVQDPWQLENLYGNSELSDDPDFSALSIQLQNARVCKGIACP